MVGRPRKRPPEEQPERPVSKPIPFDVGSTHWVMYRNEIPCLAEIIEKRPNEDGEVEFYVHYQNQDKRLDEWISKDRFLSQSTKNKLQKAGQLTIDSQNSNSESPSNSSTNSANNISRITRRRLSSRTPSVSLDPAYEKLEKEHEEATRIKNIQKIVLGRYEINCWYFSPYPDEYSQRVDRLYICEKCLKYMKDFTVYQVHFHSCDHTGPPGRVIYLKDGLSVFELDGEQAKLYCQNLCLLAKLFLDHKTLYYDVSPFMFYVVCEVDTDGVHPVGYFSKEKVSADDYNLACIMILPPYQKRGYGRLLIQLSFEITRREGKTGTPEKPLSDLGKLSYQSFWSYELLNYLKNRQLRSAPSISDISHDTGFKPDDIIETLTEMGLMRQYRGQKVLNLASKAIDALLKPFENKKFTLIDPDCLEWP